MTDQQAASLTDRLLCMYSQQSKSSGVYARRTTSAVAMQFELAALYAKAVPKPQTTPSCCKPTIQQQHRRGQQHNGTTDSMCEECENAATNDTTQHSSLPTAFTSQGSRVRKSTTSHEMLWLSWHISAYNTQDHLSSYQSATCCKADFNHCQAE